MRITLTVAALWVGALALQVCVAQESNAASQASTNATTTSANVNSENLTQLCERIAKQEEEIKHLQRSLEEQRELLDKAMSSIAAPGTATSNVANTTYAQSAPVQLVPAVNVAHPGWAQPGVALQHPETKAFAPVHQYWQHDFHAFRIC